MSLDLKTKGNKCFENIIYNMYHTFTPFRKKGGCMTGTDYKELKRYYVQYLYFYI